ncbi:3-keto-5-aminohexanoate cleavage protein [Marinomonas transparens]|uniref:3-keto-5-aminohexanoate cleavage protein n=1 Tax=Marinomonas transparens TaxID=2795388 RepID=A0A934JNN9_9GAMM|nr:3-keto-5-aminohexanoate cleavage protein [Marinomonas transparens]MBJ7539580.1 3-keto-5-aminohexanoate cleavage protein [Marinomonas transparens]
MVQKQRLVIVAPNGARKTKADHPNLPITPEEMAEEVAACVAAGAGMVHLHARTLDGQHSLDIDDNAAILKAVKERLGNRVIVQLTTEAVGLYKPEQQMALIKALVPEAASFALAELIPEPSFEQQASDFFHWVAEQNIIAQYIIYSPEQLAYYLDLKARGLLPENKHHLLLVLGRYHEKQESDPKDLIPFLPLIKQLTVRWAVCAFGRKEQDCLLQAAELGGDVRIGFENNIYTQSGVVATSNADQVLSLVKELAQKLKTETMDADTFRHFFKMG